MLNFYDMQTTFTPGAILGGPGAVSRGRKWREESFQEWTRELLRPFLKTFFAPFHPPPIDCPWVSEDDLVLENVSLLGTNLNTPFSGTYTRIPVTKYKVDILYSGSKRGNSSKLHAFTGSSEALYLKTTALRTHSFPPRSCLLVVQKW